MMAAHSHNPNSSCCQPNEATVTSAPRSTQSVLKQPSYLKAQALDIFRAAQLG